MIEQKNNKQRSSIAMSSDNNAGPIGGDQSLHSASTGSQFVMHSSAPESGNVASLAAEDEISRAEETTRKLAVDVIAIIFSFLPHQDIMRARVCTTWRDAAKKTLVPLCDFKVDSMRSYNAMRVMATALPNLQQLSIFNLCPGHKYSNGEDPDEERAAETTNYISHDINVISNFRKLRLLHIETCNLNGRYHVLFGFQFLQKFSTSECSYLKWDLEMLGFPSLKELATFRNPQLTGNLNSLRVLKDNLEKVEITNCRKIEGNFMNLADFPRLKGLNLICTNVTGDIRDIVEDDFPALESIYLPDTVHGGINYEFQLVSDVTSFMHAIHLLLKRNPTLFNEYWLTSYAFGWNLSENSPDMYDREIGRLQPPLDLQSVQAGTRSGWGWYAYGDGPEYHGRHSCEINWLDPEPISESDGYEVYIEDLQRIERHINVYRGYYEPPTAEEYRRLGLEQRD